MPAIKSQSCTTQRLEMGAFERKMLKQLIQAEAKKDDSRRFKNYADSINALLLPASIAPVAVGLGLGLKFVGEGLNGMTPGWEGFGEVRDDGTKIGIWEAIAGKKEYTFNNNDGTTSTYYNPMGGVPFFGAIGGIGANLAAAAEAKATGVRD